MNVKTTVRAGAAVDIRRGVSRTPAQALHIQTKGLKVQTGVKAGLLPAV